MSDLKDQLVRLGAERPDLRNDIRPVLAALEGKVSATKQAASTLGVLWKEARSEFLKEVLMLLEGGHGIREIEGLTGRVEGDYLRFSVYSGGDMGRQDRFDLWIPEVVREGGVIYATLGFESKKFKLDRMGSKDVVKWVSGVLRDYYGKA